MVDASRESPLHEHRDRAIGGADLSIVERPFRTIFNVRGRPSDGAFAAAIREATGLNLPGVNQFQSLDARVAAWLGPDEFMVVFESGSASDAATILTPVSGHAGALTDVSAGHTTLEVSGSNARVLLSQACALDLHPRALSPGHCLQTYVAGTAALLLLRDDSPRFDLVVRRSFADHLWRWLERAARG
jgi:sarcosine oxidase subunit gamma